MGCIFGFAFFGCVLFAFCVWWLRKRGKKIIRTLNLTLCSWKMYLPISKYCNRHSSVERSCFQFFFSFPTSSSSQTVHNWLLGSIFLVILMKCRSCLFQSPGWMLVKKIRERKTNFKSKALFSLEQKNKKMWLATRKLKILKNGKHSVYREYILVVFTCFVRAVLKNNSTNMKND